MNPAFVNNDMDDHKALIASHPMGLLVTAIGGSISATNVPFVATLNATNQLVLRGHMSRVNPQVAEMLRIVDEPIEAMVSFQGPNGYISPSFFPKKRIDGKAVPTWNYASLQCFGAVKLSEKNDVVMRILSDLTDQEEQKHVAAMPTVNSTRTKEQWAVSDAPTEYIESMLPAIVGVEIVVTRTAGKWKLTQNRTAEDQRGVVEGLFERSLCSGSRDAELAKATAVACGCPIVVPAKYDECYSIVVASSIAVGVIGLLFVQKLFGK